MSNLHKILRGTFCGCPTMIKIKKNKSKNLQTNKQINKPFLGPIYLSQIKSDLYEIFRVYSCGSSKMIKIKNKPVNKQTNK